MMMSAWLLAAVLGQADGGLGGLDGQLGGPSEALSPAQQLVAWTVEKESVDQLLDDGRHQRFGTSDRGPVHVWRPRGYSARDAAVILYVHGFYTDVDTAMREHRLVSQFRDSGRNALFIVPETRSGPRDPIYWPDLDELLATVGRRLRLELPHGPVVVVGHSGAYKTVASWLSRGPAVRAVVLIDGLYGSDDDFRRWLDDDSSPMPRQLVLVGFDTQAQVDGFVSRRPVSVRLDSLPYLYDELPAAARRAPVVALKSERFDHMSLVTEGRLLPWLLHVLK